jgi:hypothetical protein
MEEDFAMPMIGLIVPPGSPTEKGRKTVRRGRAAVPYADRATLAEGRQADA